jgi:putative oxidoreductase
MLTQYAGAKGVPRPDAAVTASGALLLFGGASILAGIKPKMGTAAVAGFLAGVSPVMHNFWNVEDPGQRMHDMVDFSKNLALLGGTLALMSVTEPWPASVPIAQPSRVEGVRKELRQRLAA